MKLGSFMNKFRNKPAEASIDGLFDCRLTGWVSHQVNKAWLIIDGNIKVELALDFERADVYESKNITANGFSIAIDEMDLPVECFGKKSISVCLVIIENNSEIVLTDHEVDVEILLIQLTKLYSEDIYLIRESELWDENYYKNQAIESPYLDDLLLDYFLFGVYKNKSPHPMFDTAFYLSNNADIQISKINPLLHYLKFGEKEGRCPNVLFNPTDYLVFNPDLSSWDKSLLEHYATHGYQEGRIYSRSTDSKVETDENAYSNWRYHNEIEDFFEITQNLINFDLNPLISVVVPVYNVSENILNDVINSILKQSYSNWQLCIADDNSTDSHVINVLGKYAQADKRIQYIVREHNGHISAASNSALAIAEGEWIVLLDHDDLLSQHALYEVVKCINENPNVEFIYSDEDKIDENGERYDPHFKSDWNVDLLYGQNYISHLSAYKKEIVDKVGGFREGYEGSQDYDLILRYSREIDHSNIKHIPKILYHWRAIKGSTALNSDEKSYTSDAGLHALSDHLDALGVDAEPIKSKCDNIYRVVWEIKDEPLVSLIVPTYNNFKITKQAIDSILNKTTYKNFEILLVDNNSDDETALAYFNEIDNHEKVTVLRYPYPFNYSAINNFASKMAKGEIIGLINNDIEVITPEWLTEMVSHSLRPGIGCVGAMLYYPDDTIQHAGVIVGLGGVAGHSHKHYPRGHLGYFNRLSVVQNLSAVTAACLLVKRSIFEQVNGLNEQDLTVAFNDVDFCLKVQSEGYRNIWTPFAELYHHESVSRGLEDNPQKIARANKEMDYMKFTWATDELIDQYYSPNLTQHCEDFSLNTLGKN